MRHTKHFEFQIRCTDNNTGESEKYAIDWRVTISHMDGYDIVNFTKDNGDPGAFMVRPECKIEIGFFEI